MKVTLTASKEQIVAVLRQLEKFASTFMRDLMECGNASFFTTQTPKEGPKPFVHLLRCLSFQMAIVSFPLNKNGRGEIPDQPGVFLGFHFFTIIRDFF